MYTRFSDLIYEIASPNVSAFAREMGEREQTVFQWIYRDSIPPRAWHKITEISEKRGQKVTLEELSNMYKNRFNDNKEHYKDA